MGIEREDMLRRIRSLQQRTIENGCTEAEALSAASLLGRLMDKYGFSQSDLEMRTENISQEAFFVKGRTIGALANCLQAVAAYADCKVWQKTKASGEKEVVFFGRESDRAGAIYLTTLIQGAMNESWRSYARGRPNSRTEKSSFEFAMSSRISERLKEMKEDRNQGADENSGRTGRDLVVVKNALVDQAYAASGVKLAKSRARTVTLRSSSAYEAGRKAGDRVHLRQGEQAAIRGAAA